jgi:hypothetical protein
LQDGEGHIFRGTLTESKANEYVLVYDPDTNTFVLERLSSLSRLSQTRTSRSNTYNGTSTPVPLTPHDRPTEHRRSKSSDDIQTISLDPPISSQLADVEESDDDEVMVPQMVTPRLPPVAPALRGPTRHEEPESSDDDDSDINIDIPRARTPQVLNKDADDDVSDEDLDDLANELESSLENRPESSSSSDADSDRPGNVKAGPNFNNIPRSGGPISMNAFARGRRRDEESSSSESEDDDDD